MRKTKLLLIFIFLLCSGCTSIQYNFCNEGIPPGKADKEIKRLFKNCSSSTDMSLGDKSRRYYAAYAKGKNAEEQARQTVAARIRRDIVGQRKTNIPLYGLELFKHFRYNEHYWEIWYIPAREYNILKKKFVPHRNSADFLCR